MNKVIRASILLPMQRQILETNYEITLLLLILPFRTSMF